MTLWAITFCIPFLISTPCKADIETACFCFCFVSSFDILHLRDWQWNKNVVPNGKLHYGDIFGEILYNMVFGKQVWFHGFQCATVCFVGITDIITFSISWSLVMYRWLVLGSRNCFPLNLFPFLLLSWRQSYNEEISRSRQSSIQTMYIRRISISKVGHENIQKRRCVSHVCYTNYIK